MKKLAVSFAALALWVGALPVSAARQGGAAVEHGQAIGKLRLGMTIPEVRRVLGPPHALNTNERRRNGYVYREFGWDIGWWTVGFMRPPGGEFRAVRIGTVSRAQRTRERLGVASTDRQVYIQLRGVFCRFVADHVGRGRWSECIYRRAGGRQTAFILESYHDPDDPPNIARVAQIEVRDLLFYRGWRLRFHPR